VWGPGRHRKKFPRKMLREIHKAERLKRKSQLPQSWSRRTVAVKLEPESPEKTSFDSVDTTFIKVEPVDDGYDHQCSSSCDVFQTPQTLSQPYEPQLSGRDVGRL